MTEMLWELALPAASNAWTTIVYVIDPFLFGTFHVQLTGEVGLPILHKFVPLTRKFTCVTPTLSLSVALMVTLLPALTVAPLIGEVIVMVGGVVSSGAGTGVGVGGTGVAVSSGAGVFVGFGVVVGRGVLVGNRVGVGDGNGV